MKAITKKSVQAFVEAVNFRESNTRVEVVGNNVFFYLFDNMIAHQGFDDKGWFLYITTCGYNTNTTKERLNGILQAFDLGYINQKNFKWFLNSEPFNGSHKFQITK